MNEAFAKQCAMWRIAGQHHEIIAAVEAIDHYQEDLDLVIEWARGYIGLAMSTESSAQKDYYLRVATEGLLAWHDRLPQPASSVPLVGVDPWREWHYQLGFAYLQLDLPHRAASQFDALVRVDPNYRDAKARLKESFEKQPDLLRHRSFDQRVQDFWRVMTDPEVVDTLNAHRNLTDPDILSEAFAMFEQILGIAIKDRDGIALTNNGDRLEVLLPVAGNYPRVMRYVQLLAQKPQNCAFDFTIGFPAVEELPEEATRLRMVCRLAQKDPHVFVVGFAEEDLAAHPEAERRQVALRYLHETLGELAALRYVGDVALLSTLPSDETVYHLPDLRRLITDQGLSLDVSAKALVTTLYSFADTPQDEDFLRSDITHYSTTCLDLVSDWRHLESTTFDAMMDDGALAGMFLLPVGKTEAESQQILQTFQKAIHQDLGEEAWRVVSFVGAGYGTKYTYLDFVSWRLRPLVRAAAHVMAQLGLQTLGYQPFDFRYPVAPISPITEKDHEKDFN